MHKLTRLLALFAVAALVVPAGVFAKGGHDSEKHRSKNQSEHRDKAKSKTEKAAKRCKKQHRVGFTLRGTLDPASTSDAIVVVVTKANKHAKAFVVDGKYALGADSSKAAFKGANPFTTAGADLSQYRVKVVGKVVKPKKRCASETAPSATVRKVKVSAPETGDDRTTEAVKS